MRESLAFAHPTDAVAKASDREWFKPWNQPFPQVAGV